MRSSARSPTPATSPGRARRGVAMRMTGAAPCASSSHSVGRASNSPSLSRPVMSASTTGGKRAGAMQPLSPPFDVTAFGKFAQHALERGAVGILGAERAGDLARADLAGALADEGEELLARGQGGCVS